jgi:glutamyl-Q tRNA(Asp) synthetase
LLHLGHVVNAVYVWSIARAFGGTVLLRIEDHDRQRCKREFEDRTRDDLDWLGLTADVDDRDSPSLYRQSDNGTLYTAACDALDAAARVYPCRCSRQQLLTNAEMNDRRYPGTCRAAGVPANETSARRFVIDDRAVSFDDLRHGQQMQRPHEQCGDMLIRDRFGQWTYQFAVTIDDDRHAIDVVIRGDDLLPSTGRQLALRAAIGREAAPLFLHHPLILRPDGRKLSKSLGDSGIAEMRLAGIPPEHVLGRAAFLGGLQSTSRPVHALDVASLWI